MRALWEMGFFGKGTLSRSEPSWLERERVRLRKEKYGSGGRKAAEDATNARRRERRLFKLERARLEREQIERQKLVEEGQPVPALGEGTVVIQPAESAVTEKETSGSPEPGPAPETDPAVNVVQSGHGGGVAIKSYLKDYDPSTPILDQRNNQPATQTGRVPDAELLQPRPSISGLIQDTSEKDALATLEEEPDVNIENQEHLQLTLEEAFFLHYGLGVLQILPQSPILSPPTSPKSSPHTRYTTTQLCQLFTQHSTFPPSPATTDLAPDDHFLLSYITYHHFRSLGWVVRPGMKFSVDYLLYNRGPVFSHAEFAVLIVPSYTDRYWNTPGGRSRRRVWEKKDWWWLHCVNRVQSQVKKTLVLCYVDVPSPLSFGGLSSGEEEERDVGALLARYRVREFVVRRWVGNRNRD